MRATTDNSKAQRAKRKRMRKIVERMQEFTATYTKQREYKNYSDDTFIEDMLYGIGVALKPDEFNFANGFDKFKHEVLTKHIRSTDEALALIGAK